MTNPRPGAGREVLHNSLQHEGGLDDPADRALLGQILTFASFLGGLSLAAMVEVMSAADGFGATTGTVTDGMPETTKLVVIMLGATGTSSLIAAFFALLGSIHAGRLLDRRARLRYHASRGEQDPQVLGPVTAALARAVAAVIVFRQSARALAVLGMATGLASTLLLLYAALGMAAIVFFVIAIVGMALPWLAVSLMRARMLAVAPEVWAAAMQDEPDGVAAAVEEAANHDDD